MGLTSVLQQRLLFILQPFTPAKGLKVWPALSLPQAAPLSHRTVVGMTSEASRVLRMAEAWEEKSPRTEKVVMAASFRSGGPKRMDDMNGGREHTPGLVSDVIHLGSQTLWSLLFGFWAFSYGMEEQTSLHSWRVVWGSLSLGRPMSDAVAKVFLSGFPNCRIPTMQRRKDTHNPIGPAGPGMQCP